MRRDRPLNHEYHPTFPAVLMPGSRALTAFQIAYRKLQDSGCRFSCSAKAANWIFSEVRVTGSPASVPMLIREPAIFQHPWFVYVRRKK
jgi:hypothetical protein